MDLKVRTHRDGVAFKPTEAAVALYDEAGFDVEHDELEHLYEIDAGQEYRTAAVDVILSNVSAQLPADVVCVVSSKCRMSKGEWYETELTEALDVHHKATDGAKVPSLLPRKGQKTNIFFCAPRRPVAHAAVEEPMDCSRPYGTAWINTDFSSFERYVRSTSRMARDEPYGAWRHQALPRDLVDSAAMCPIGFRETVALWLVQPLSAAEHEHFRPRRASWWVGALHTRVQSMVTCRVVSGRTALALHVLAPTV
eukprot:361061-Prymnesium_polylepis.1